MRLLPPSLLFAILAAPCLAQTIQVKPELLIAARQRAMDLSYGTFTGMKIAIKDKADVKIWEVPAQALAGWAAIIPSMYPAGTEKGLDTAALPAVWSDAPGFAKAAANYADAAKQLAAAAKAGDAAGFAVAYKETGKACGACHKGYKKKEE